MVKFSKKQIIRDENKVIRELQRNAKSSIDEISKKCGFSRQKVWRIIKRLEKNKTIWGYTAIVDNEKQDLKNFIVLIKRTTLPSNKELVNKIITRQLDGKASRIGVKVESSLFLHGAYDWLVTFNTKDISKAKKFCEILNDMYKGYISELHLLQTMVPVKKQGILNPNTEKLKEFLPSLLNK
jgi:DNA-binding Lrp family transcriptional regulator